MTLLTWSDNSGNEDGFKLQRSIDNTNFNLINTLGANVTSYSDMGLNDATKYYYRVRSYNSVGSSDFSNTASATTLPTPTPTPTPKVANVTFQEKQKGSELTIDTPAARSAGCAEWHVRCGSNTQARVITS